jgi:large subunit ribosomal protein L15
MLRRLVALAALVGASSLQLPGPVVAGPRCAAPSMKVFDWKTRGEAPPALETIDLGNLKASPGSNQRHKRKGRGISAGQGQSCGFGNRGQKSRSGRPTRPGFEGGQIPLHRRLPKFVGRPMGPGHSKTEYGLIKLEQLNKMPDNSEIDYAALMEAKAATKSKYHLKKVVVSEEALTAKGITVKAHAFTDSARQAIEGAGGKCITLSPTTDQPVEAAA